MSWKILNAYERERYNGKMMSIKSSRWYNTSWLNGYGQQLKPRQIDPSFLGSTGLQSIPECLGTQLSTLRIPICWWISWSLSWFDLTSALDQNPFLQVLGVQVVHPSKQSYLRRGLEVKKWQFRHWRLKTRSNWKAFYWSCSFSCSHRSLGKWTNVTSAYFSTRLKLPKKIAVMKGQMFGQIISCFHSLNLLSPIAWKTIRMEDWSK